MEQYKTMIVEINNMTKSFGEHLILDGVSLMINDKGRYGLIGENGAGKSTLLKVICGELEPDSGTISFGSNSSIGFLKQDSGLNVSNNIYEEMESVFNHLFDIETQMKEIEKSLFNLDTESEDYENISTDYTRLQNYFEVNDGYNIDSKIKTILNGMGFSNHNLDTNIDRLSGGEKTRLALAKLLLEQPNLLILDEPTNHLDFDTLTWLEGYLQTYNGAVLVVSHDRYFLDTVVENIFEIERHKLNIYSGNYSKYLILKEERYDYQLKLYGAQQKEIEKMEDYVRRNMARASTTKSAQSRVKALERMDILDAPIRHKSRIKLSFETTSEPYKDLLSVQNIDISVGEGNGRKTLCEDVSFKMEKNEKVAIVGKNGIGKSTFLKILLKILPHSNGKIKWGENVVTGYFEQEMKGLSQHKTVIEELWDRYPQKTEFEIRSRLGSVGITGENVYKKVNVISGGEKAKLKFAILSFKSTNFIIMDEPTNHLDLMSKEILEDALAGYSGSLLFVSHDRYLLTKVPSKIIEITEDGVVEYLGNYESYKQLKQREQLNASKENNSETGEPNKKVDSSNNNYFRSKKQRSLEIKRKQDIKYLENFINEVEKKISDLETEMTYEDVFSDYKLMEEKCTEVEELKKQLGNYMSKWEELIVLDV